MKRKIYTIAVGLLTIAYTGEVNAQIINPIHWSYSSKRFGATEAVIFFHATLDNGWHV